MQTFVYILGAGIGGNLLFFPLAYLALRKQLALSFSIAKLVLLFFICAPITGIAQLLMRGGTETSYMGLVATLAVPILVSASVIAAAQKLTDKKKREGVAP